MLRLRAECVKEAIAGKSEKRSRSGETLVGVPERLASNQESDYCTVK
jgi:hypothetical protein